MIDRTVGGGTVHHVEYRSDAAAHLLQPMELGLGCVPAAGATEYGQATRGSATGAPWARIHASPRLGSGFQLEYRTGLPNSPGGEIMALGRAAQPLPLPNGWLLVDPASAVLGFRFTDGSGVLRGSHAVPNVAGLLSLPLAFQGVAHDAAFTLSLTKAVAAIVLP